MKTQPADVTVYDDTTQGPTLAVRRVTVDRRPGKQTVALLYEVGAQTRRNKYEMPAWGEALDVRPQVQKSARYGTPSPRPDTTRPDTARPDTVVRRDTVAAAQLRGSPEPKETQAEVQEDPRSWWGRQWDRAVNLLAGVGAIALLFGVGGLALRATRFSLPI